MRERQLLVAEIYTPITPATAVASTKHIAGRQQRREEAEETEGESGATSKGTNGWGGHVSNPSLQTSQSVMTPHMQSRHHCCATVQAV